MWHASVAPGFLISKALQSTAARQNVSNCNKDLGKYHTN